MAGYDNVVLRVLFIYLFIYFILFFLCVGLFGFYGPFKNISLVSRRSFIKGGRNPGENHLTIRKQNLAFPHGYRVLDWSRPAWLLSIRFVTDERQSE